MLILSTHIGIPSCSETRQMTENDKPTNKQHKLVNTKISLSHQYLLSNSQLVELKNSAITDTIDSQVEFANRNKHNSVSTCEFAIMIIQM